MQIFLKIHTENDPNLLANAIRDIKEINVETKTRTRFLTPDIVVALGSAGAFTVLYNVICKFLERKTGDITIERSIKGKKVRVTIKKANLPDLIEILEKLAPEFVKK